MPSSDGLMDLIRLRLFQALSQGSFLKVSNKRKDGTNYRDINCFRSLFFLLGDANNSTVPHLVKFLLTRQRNSSHLFPAKNNKGPLLFDC